MKYRHLTGFALALFATVMPSVAQNTAQQEIISASTMIAVGRPALATELTEPAYAGKTLAELVEMHRDGLRSDHALQKQVHEMARWDVSGLLIRKAGFPYAHGVTYAESVKEGLAQLARQPEEYRRVINRAYQLVIRRDAYPEEIEYWKPYGTLPYVVLVGAIENWAERNQPGLMVTNGTPSININSRFLRTQRLSLSVANEARVLLDLPVWTDVARQHSPGRNVVAVGAREIASVGGMHFLLAGGGPLAGE